MILFLRKYTTIISILLLPVLLILFWLFPGSGLLLGIIFFVMAFALASSIVLEKHMQAYNQDGIPQQAFTRGVILEMFGILLAMVLAGLLARYISEIAMKHSNNDFTKFVVGIVTGLLIGIGVGTLVRRVWKHFLIASPDNE